MLAIISNFSFDSVIIGFSVSEML